MKLLGNVNGESDNYYKMRAALESSHLLLHILISLSNPSSLKKADQISRFINHAERADAVFAH
jgi:hypothetical protein